MEPIWVCKCCRLPNSIVVYGSCRPMFADSIAIIGCVGAGWLSGPILGNALWKLAHRKVLGRVEQMDNVFLNHIKKKRVDPSRQSVNNPVSLIDGTCIHHSMLLMIASTTPLSQVPDYYGEKIGSMKGYRQWLRDQATYRRKARELSSTCRAE